MPDSNGDGFMRVMEADFSTKSVSFAWVFDEIIVDRNGAGPSLIDIVWGRMVNMEMHGGVG